MGNKNIPGQITEQDKAACETIQEAYNNALEGLSVLEERVGDMQKFADKQRVCRMSLPDEKYCADYLGGALNLFTVQQKRKRRTCFYRRYCSLVQCNLPLEP